MVEGVRRELVLSDGRWNMGRFIGEELIERFGFEEEPANRGVFRRIVDTQHAAVVIVDGWDELPGGGRTSAAPTFGVARRDINELWHELLDTRIHRWRPSITESKPFFDRQPVVLKFTQTPVAVAAWLDEWIPGFVDKAPRWSFVEAENGFDRCPPTQESAELGPESADDDGVDGRVG